MFCHVFRTFGSLRVPRPASGYLFLAGVVLAIGTIALFRYAPVYFPKGALNIPEVSEAAYAELGAAAETLRAGFSPRLGVAYREIPVVPGNAYYVRAELMASGIEWRDDLDRNSGRLVFLFRRNGQPMHGLRHTVAELRQPYEWHVVDDFFKAPSGVSTAYVGLDLWSESGQIGMRNLAVRGAATSAWHRYGRPILAAGWCLLLLVVLWPVLSSKTRGLASIVGALTAVAIVMGATIPKPLLLRAKDALLSPYERTTAVTETTQEPVDLFMAPTGFTLLTKVQKVGHLLLFGILYCFLQRKYALRISLSLAAITEFLQYFVADREPSIMDFGIDCLGIAIGIALVATWRRFFVPQLPTTVAPQAAVIRSKAL